MNLKNNVEAVAKINFKIWLNFNNARRIWKFDRKCRKCIIEECCLRKFSGLKILYAIFDIGFIIQKNYTKSYFLSYQSILYYILLNLKKAIALFLFLEFEWALYFWILKSKCLLIQGLYFYQLWIQIYAN